MSISVLKRRYWGGVYRIRIRNAPGYVCKTGDRSYDPHCEASMLRRLAESGLNVPTPIHVEDGLLVLEARSAGPADNGCAARAGDRLAALHLRGTAPMYGYPNSTPFGSLCLDNGWSGNWGHFFIERRLLRFAEDARRANRLSAGMEDGIGRVAERMTRVLPEPERPALLHGDIWANNLLSIAGEPLFLDPASFYGDPDYDVAFMACYLDLRQAAIKAYRHRRPLTQDFWRIKLPAYRLAFDLAHLALFGDVFEATVQTGISRVLAV